MNKSKPLKQLQPNYKLNELSEKTVQSSPFRQFEIWFKYVLKSNFIEPNAMILATADAKARPSARVVLLKGFSNQGLIFFTNYNSRKSNDILNNKSAAILFYWDEIYRQVRVEGKVKKISKEESEKYFHSRAKDSQIAACISNQSSIIPNRNFLDEKFAELKNKFGEKEIPLPEFWGGYRLIPDYFEFWQGRENRLHDRICYKKQKKKWKVFRLAP